MKLKSYLPLMLLFLFASCSSVPDVPILTRIDFNKCAYAYTISDKSGVIDDVNLLNGKTCLDYVNEGLIVPVDSWMDLKKFIVKKCRQTPKYCEGVGDWNNKINIMDGVK